MIAWGDQKTRAAYNLSFSKQHETEIALKVQGQNTADDRKVPGPLSIFLVFAMTPEGSRLEEQG